MALSAAGWRLLGKIKKARVNGPLRATWLPSSLRHSPQIQVTHATYKSKRRAELIASKSSAIVLRLATSEKKTSHHWQALQMRGVLIYVPDFLDTSRRPSDHGTFRVLQREP